MFKLNRIKDKILMTFRAVRVAYLVFVSIEKVLIYLGNEFSFNRLLRTVPGSAGGVRGA